MHHLLLSVAVVVAAYLCGALPTGVWAAGRAGVDVRRAGSGNIGATNVARTAGRHAALLTLGGDIVKGLIPVLVARCLSLPPWALASVGLAAVLGHVFSVFLHFSGGKGVATACGAFLGIAPLAMVVALVSFAAIAATTRYVSLASVTAALVLPVAGVAFGYAAPVCSGAILVAMVVVIRHRDNLSRLWHGTEPKFQIRR